MSTKIHGKNTEGIFSPTQIGRYVEKASHIGCDGNWFMK